MHGMTDVALEQQKGFLQNLKLHRFQEYSGEN